MLCEPNSIEDRQYAVQKTFFTKTIVPILEVIKKEDYVVPKSSFYDFFLMIRNMDRKNYNLPKISTRQEILVDRFRVGCKS